jgi:hypothetical protein
MKVLFADSFYFFAVLNPQDEAHQRAMAYSGANCPPLLTTPWVLTEVADGLGTTGNRRLF